MGVKVANISPALAEELRLDASAEGVVIARDRRRLARAESRLPARRRDRGGQQREDRAHARSRPHRQGVRTAPLGASRSCAAASTISRAVRRMSTRAETRATEPVRSRGPRARRAASARRQAAADEACRGGRAGPSARARRRAHPHAGDALARLADVLGAARHRQDHGGAAAGATRPSCISSRFPRCSPASPTSRRCSRRRARGARSGRARCCSSTRCIASTARSRTASCR